jgi:RHS repeat-associated protein
MTDEKGNVVWEVVDKHPFGEFEVKGKTVNLSDYGGVESWSYTVENPLRFPGQYNDYNYRSVVISGKKGPYYNYHRWYNPDIGRYMEVDPVIFNNNFYIYASDVPVMVFDIDGMKDCYGTWMHCNPFWVRWINPTCKCYWYCQPCNTPILWSGNISSCEEVIGYLKESGFGGYTRGDSCLCGKPEGRETGCKNEK